MNKLRELQLAEIELIRIFIDICKEEHLTYYMLGGTLLGAIRHKGYIPWDDDADFGMPRPDYERFLKVSDKYLSGQYKAESFQKTEGYQYYFARVINEGKKVKVHAHQKALVDNAWIDIFPLDGMPNGGIRRKIHSARLMVLRGLYKISVFSTHVGIYLPHRVWYERLIIAVCKRIPFEKFFSPRNRLNALDRALKNYSYEKSDYLVNFMGAYKFREMFPKKVYGNGKLYEFEGMTLNGPEDYDFVCKQLYGDYMTPPPEEERNKHFTETI